MHAETIYFIILIFFFAMAILFIRQVYLYFVGRNS